MSFQGSPLQPSVKPLEPDTLGAPWPTIAEPITFAPPVEVREEDDAWVLLFEVGGRGEDDLQVEIDGRTLVILGEFLPRSPRWTVAARARRAFGLPTWVDTSQARMRVISPMLEVRFPRSGTSRGRAIVVRG